MHTQDHAPPSPTNFKAPTENNTETQAPQVTTRSDTTADPNADHTLSEEEENKRPHREDPEMLEEEENVDLNDLELSDTSSNITSSKALQEEAPGEEAKS